MRAVTRWVVAVFAVGCAAFCAHGGEGWEAALGRLSPEEPIGYFLLGEDVADAADGVAGVRLAERLHVLAFELGMRAGDASLAASAAIALAKLSRDEDRARALRALSRTVDPRRGAARWFGVERIERDRESALTAAIYVGLVRAGFGRPARRLLEDAEVVRLLETYDPLMGVRGAPGGFDALQRASALWPCPECDNELIVPIPGSRPIERRACSTCLGTPGPRLSREQLIGQLRLESRLLSGVGTSWAAQVASDFGAPLVDPTPESLAPWYGIDPSRSVYRGGEWVAPEAGAGGRVPPPRGAPDAEPEGLLEGVPEMSEPAGTAKPNIVFDDFAKLDLRVARITKAEPHPNADRLLKLQLDDGSGEPRQICAGIRSAYEPGELEGRLIVIVANLEPRELRGETSRGMLLAASDAAKGDADRSVVLVAPMSDIAPGSAVS